MTELRGLLTKAKNDPTFLDKLLRSPADTLTAEGLRPDQHWVDFFSGLQASNFEEEMNKLIDMSEAGEGSAL